MGRVVYRTAVTVTGHLADEAGSLDWLLALDSSAVPPFDQVLAATGAQVMGSTTYRWLVEHEDLLARPGRWQEVFGALPTFVLTTRALPVPEGADVRLVRGDVRALLPELRAAAGDRDLWVVGGGDVAGQFADAGALDALVLTVAPVALPGGAAVLPRRLAAGELRLEGVVQQGPFAELRYAVGGTAEG